MERHSDGGATVRLSEIELTRMFNGLVYALRPPLTWVDGTPIQPEATHSLRLQLHQVAVLLGRDDIPHPDQE